MSHESLPTKLSVVGSLRTLGAAARRLSAVRSGRSRAVVLSVLTISGIVAAVSAFSTSSWARGVARSLFRTTELASGDTTVVYGPKRFASPTGSATLGIERFTLVVQPNQEYVLQVDNGASDGTLRASSMSVDLNGRTVMTLADLGGARSGKKIIQALAEDTLRVTVQGGAGAYVDVSVLQTADPTFAVFGPHLFIRNAGSPTTETFNFSVPAAGASPFSMCVINGNPDGTLRASSATILLNGVQILDQSELNQQVAGLRKQVTLQQSNTIEVRISSIPESRLTLCFSATDVAPPRLAIVTPTTRQITRDATIAVTGTVDDETATSVTVNGLTATRSGSSYSATATLAAEGENTILVSAIDAAGNRTDSSRVVIHDSQAPVITLTSPSDNSITNNATAAVTGTVNDITTTTINVNGVPLTVGTGGVFSGSVTLSEGSNFVTVTGTDQAGNATSVARHVTLDTHPPVIAVSQPVDGLLTKQTTVALAGTVTDATTVTLQVNGTPVTVSAEDGSFSVPSTALANEGDNTFTFVATDAAGNNTTATRHVTRDTQPPTLTIAAPADNEITNNASVTVSGSATDASAVTVTVNGTPATRDASGTFSAPVTLSEGPATITVVATDAAGNASTATRTRTIDLTPPTLTVTQPSGRVVTKENVASVSGSVSDATAVSLTVNGVTTTVATDGTFSTTVPLTAEGSAPISFTATDAAGNHTDVSRSVIRDTSAPTVTLTTPNDGFITKNGTVHVAGTAVDATAVTLDVNGIPVTLDPMGAFAVDVPISTEGSNPILVRATDEAGNSAAPTRGVILDTHAPVIAVTSPADGAIVPSSPVTVTGTVTDQTATTLTVNGTPTPLGTGGSFSASVAVVSGANTITLVATDAAINSATDTRTVTRKVLEPGIPPDPSTIAPALNRTVPTSQFAATQFLYTGSDPTQKGVAAGTIDFVRGGTIRGKVVTKTYEPLMGVNVTIRNHPEYGTTKTREDGTFDMVVNGGGPLLVDFAKSTYLPVQRTANVPWHDFAVLDSIVMLQLDPQVTTVNLASQTIQVAQGTLQQDADGQRQATVLVEPGTQATMVMPDGTRQPLTTMSLRLTEFTTGPTGQAAMPGTLPPSSMYTYAFQITADEAVAAGATSIELNKPTPVYVQNFLQFPAGTIVPVGALDVTKGAWVAQDNGKVIKVLNIDGGVAAVDANGDGVADSDSALTAMGLDLAERQTLAATYQPGVSLWRILPTKYWPTDPNWPGFPIGTDPQGDVSAGCASKLADPIRCDIQVARQSVGITGTPLALVYGSDRSAGGNPDRTITVTLTGPTISPDLKQVELIIGVAGREFRWTFAPQPNLIFPFTWDGKDAYGRTMQGKQPISVDIGHVYPMVYTQPATDRPRAFGEPCTGTAGGGTASCNLSFVLSADGSRTYRPRWQHISSTIGGWDAKALGLGGFTLSNHNTYDPVGQVLYQGDGVTRAAKRIPEVITTAAGRGSNHLQNMGNRVGFGDFSGDGGPAVNAQFFAPSDVSVGPDGSIFVADQWNGRYRQIAPNGIITTVSGNGVAGHNNVAEGDSATKANHFLPAAVLAAPDGGFFTLDLGEGRIRKVGADGKIRTFAGIVNQGGFSGDGGPATAAKFSDIGGMALGPDGSLYIADRSNHRVRRVTPDGIVTTIAGNGGGSNTGDGGPALQAQVSLPSRIAVGPDGSVYVVVGLNTNLIRRITPGGIITTVVGGGTNNLSDGQLATSVGLDFIGEVKVAPNGMIYFQRRTAWYFVVPSTNRIYTMILSTQAGPVVEGAIAAKATEAGAGRLAVAPDGALYTVLPDSGRVRRIAPPMPGASVGEVAIMAENGRMVFIFDRDGRHLRTLSSMNRDTLWSFVYDQAANLVATVDRTGDTTRIRRDPSGAALSVSAQSGLETQLTLAADGNLQIVEAPDGSIATMQISPNGLVQSAFDPSGRSISYSYDSNGLVVGALRSGDSLTKLVTNGDGLNSSLSLVQGSQVALNMQSIAISPTSRQTVIGFAGSTEQTTIGADGLRTVRDPDGTLTTVAYRSDPLGSVPGLPDSSITTPSGLRRTVHVGRSVSLGNVFDLSSIRTQTDSLVVNGNLTTDSYDRVTGTLTTISPMGRSRVTKVDSLGRVIQQLRPDAPPVVSMWDANSQLLSVRQGSRHTTITYDSLGRMRSTTDALGMTHRYAFDVAGRLTQRISPDGRLTQVSYDSAGRVIGITPPGRSAHRVTYDPNGQIASYIPPALPGDSSVEAFHLRYDGAGRLLRMERAGGGSVSFAYDTLGRRVSMGGTEGSWRYSYQGATGAVATATTPANNIITYTYDGPLQTRIAWSGAVTGSISSSYDADFRTASQNVNGAQSITYSYDRDGLLQTAGLLQLTRSVSSGVLLGTTLGRVSTALEYDSLGLVHRVTASLDTTILFQQIYTRDAIGRVTGVEEDGEGVQRSRAFTYDSAGRFSGSIGNGLQERSYVYDANGNRTLTTDASGSVAATFDARDRLIQAGQVTYEYDALGRVTGRVDGTGRRTYSYDSFDRLTAIQFPDGKRLDYVLDAEGRRIGRRQNGVLTQGFLYANSIAPTAELNGSSQVVSRFVFGESANVPEYMLRDGKTYRFVADNHGSVRFVVDVVTGEVVQALEYDDFGRVLSDSRPGFQPFGYAGGLYDPTSQLTHFDNREYDAEMGRWTTPDPTLFQGGSENLYAYVKNDPINAIDTRGTTQADLADLTSTMKYNETLAASRLAGIALRCADKVVQAEFEAWKTHSEADRMGACASGIIYGAIEGTLIGPLAYKMDVLGYVQGPLSRAAMACAVGVGTTMVSDLYGAIENGFADRPSNGAFVGHLALGCLGSVISLAGGSIKNPYYGAIAGSIFASVLDWAASYGSQLGPYGRPND
ncbi:MAG TPA: Ig-like domain-containing protein [Gemmatimonadaceae bacterium]|nr:Ig-like domain-containing protein [Gemmatimonadaceae bacterium]